jgi:glycosyltransferase involved in cell wall biosynthesis
MIHEESSEHIIEDLGIEPLYIEEMYRELSPLKDYKSYQRIRKIIADFKPDIVHTHAAKSGAVGRLAALHAGVPVILHTFHGHVFHSYFGAAKTRVFLEIERYLGKRSSAIITLSDIQKKELVDDFKIASTDKFHIVPLGFNLSKFTEHQAEKRAAFRAEWNIADDEVAIGIVGRLVSVKNHPLFFKAIKKLTEQTDKKIRAIIIGDGEDRIALEKLANELGLSFSAEKNKNATLTFTSWRKDIDVTNAGMDIIALSSLNEGTPVSLIEAQASGKPIVSTNVGGIANVVQEGKTALLSPSGDVAAFTANLLQLVEDENLRKSLSGHGVAYVLENFSHLRLAKDMAELYRRLLAEKGL